MDVKDILINDAKVFHNFLGSSLQLLESRQDRTADDSSLNELRNSLTELRALYDERVEKDINWLGSLIARIPPYKLLGKFLQKPAPKMRLANYPSFMESDLSWRRKRLQVSLLIQKFQSYSLEDLKSFSKYLDLESSNLKFGVHGEAELKSMLPAQAWIAIGFSFAWCAFWASVFGYTLPSVTVTLSDKISDSLTWAVSAFFVFVFGLISIISIAIGKYENLSQSRNIALISRWLKLYIEVTENANNRLHKDA